MLLAGTAILVLVVDLFLDDRAKLVNNYLALAGTVAAGIALATLVGQGNRSTFGGSFVIDNYALLFKGLFLGSLVLVLLMSGRYIAQGTVYQGEFYFLDRKSTRLNSSHVEISYAVFCLKKKKTRTKLLLVEHKKRRIRLTT